MGNKIEALYHFLMRGIQKWYWPLFIAACFTLFLFCFFRLDVKYVDSWDEARHGVNAYEMLQNRDFIRHTYNYEVDGWNLKPSLSYWGILAGFRLFGYSVFGLRFYSALSYLITGILAGLFVGRRSRAGGILVMGFFCANTLPLYAHLARAGDADSLYLLFFTAAMLAMMEIPKNRKNLYICGLCFSLAFLTKSWHAGMIAAVGGLYLLLTGEIRRIRLREWGFFLLSIFVPLLLWFGWRYQADGFYFLKQMVQVDLLARTGTANFEGHSFPFSFYWELVFGNKGYIYPWLAGACAVGAIAVVGLGIQAGKGKAALREWLSKEVFQVGLGLFLWFAVVFFGFSFMRTKLIWYCYPAVVPLFMAAALVLGKALEAEAPEGSGGRFLAAAQMLLAAGCMVLVSHFMRVTYDMAVRNAQGDVFQSFMRASASQGSPYAGRDAYIEVAGEYPEELGSWDQNRLFLAEISGNFHCKDGGLQAFLKSEKDSVLYMDLEGFQAYGELLEGCEKLWLDSAYPYVLVGKSGLPSPDSEGDGAAEGRQQK